MPKLRTAGSAPGTRLALLRGGPPEWDAQVVSVSATATGQLERWCHTADLALVYAPTDRTEPVSVPHERRGGTVWVASEAVVYEYLGYRDEVPRPGETQLSPHLAEGLGRPRPSGDARAAENGQAWETTRPRTRSAG